MDDEEENGNVDEEEEKRKRRRSSSSQKVWSGSREILSVGSRTLRIADEGAVDLQMSMLRFGGADKTAL